MLAGLGQFKFVNNGAVQISATAGIQGVGSVFASANNMVMGVTDWTNIFASLVPAEARSGMPQKVVIQKMKVTYLISNATNANATVTMYDVVCRKDIANAINASPEIAWKNGISNETAAGATATAYLTIGATPFSADLLRSFIRSRTPHSWICLQDRCIAMSWSLCLIGP